MRHRARDLVRHAEHRANRKEISFDLWDHLPALQARIDAGKCEVTGLPLNLKGGRTWDSPSLDRIDPQSGYVYSNVRVVCHGVNSAMGDWGEQKLVEMAKAILDMRRQKSNAFSRALGERLKARIQDRGSTLYSMTWNELATPQGRTFFRLAASAPRTSASASGSSEKGWTTPQAHDTTGRSLGQKEKHGTKHGCACLVRDADLTAWPTPNANDWKGAYQDVEKNLARTAAGHQVTMQDAARLAGWPTPATTDHKGGYMGGRMRNGKLSTDRLDVTAQIAGWNTPAASDGNGGKRPHPDTTMTGQHPEGRKVNMGLASQVHIGFIKTEPARLTATGEMLTGSSAGMESGGQLNPAHSRWLMGLPPEWDACAPTAMPSSRKSRQK
jgi:hypothetical protein